MSVTGSVVENNDKVFTFFFFLPAGSDLPAEIWNFLNNNRNNSSTAGKETDMPCRRRKKKKGHHSDTGTLPKMACWCNLGSLYPCNPYR